MDQSLFTYDIIAEDPKTHARAGVLHTPHGDVPTPIFMPVGTKANVKGIPTETVRDLGAKIVLANTYHLAMRPSADTIAELGGLHTFMNWHGPILTDSGGFQVFSHQDAVKLTDDGVRFIATDYDGSHVFWTPEDNMAIAQKLGSDICMQLDQCPGYPAERSFVARAVELSSMWAERCYAAHTRPDQALFGIVQGGMHLDLRLRSLKHLEECGDFPGYGIGGYSVGEDHETMGRLNFKNARFAKDPGPVDAQCTCPVCTGGYSRALIRHMVTQKEMLGGILLSMHNICFLLDLMARAREAIIEGRYAEFRDEWMASEAAADY